MTFAARQSGTLRRVAARFGGGAKATFTRRSTLKDTKTPGALILLVDGTVAAGGSQVTLDAPGVLDGTLPAGIPLKIGADPTVYTTQNEVKATGGKLVGVKLSPVLVTQAGDNATVVLQAQKVTYSVPVVVGGFRDLDRNGTLIQAGDRRVLADTTRLPIKLRDDDAITLPGEAAAIAIVELRRYKGGLVESGVLIHARGGTP